MDYQRELVKLQQANNRFLEGYKKLNNAILQALEKAQQAKNNQQEIQLIINKLISNK